MADLYLDLQPDLAKLRSSGDDGERDVAEFIEATLTISDIDRDNHNRGLYDFKNELLRWGAKTAARAALKLERFSVASYVLTRLSIMLLQTTVSAPFEEHSSLLA